MTEEGRMTEGGKRESPNITVFMLKITFDINKSSHLYRSACQPLLAASQARRTHKTPLWLPVSTLAPIFLSAFS